MLFDLLPFVVPKWVRQVLSSPVLWAVLAGLYCVQWGDARGYARHAAEVAAATTATNTRISEANGAEGARVAESDRTREDAAREAVKELTEELARIGAVQGVAKKATSIALPAFDQAPTQVAAAQCPEVPSIPEAIIAKLNRIKK